MRNISSNGYFSTISYEYRTMKLLYSGNGYECERTNIQTNLGNLSRTSSKMPKVYQLCTVYIFIITFGRLILTPGFRHMNETRA